tara:strand:+ start:241 stop:510 length:270 start_codon:yes stop_codon:yes gene_type:complete
LFSYNSYLQKFNHKLFLKNKKPLVNKDTAKQQPLDKERFIIFSVTGETNNKFENFRQVFQECAYFRKREKIFRDILFNFNYLFLFNIKS